MCNSIEFELVKIGGFFTAAVFWMKQLTSKLQQLPRPDVLSDESISLQGIKRPST
jgi:hypothetical protein